MKNSAFIVFEGIECSGKTTQISNLQRFLSAEGKRVICTRQPGGTELGTGIRKLLLDTNEAIDPVAELLLFMADRAQHSRRMVDQLLDGNILLCDRFTASTLAYQGYGRGFNQDVILYLNTLTTASGMLRPDLTIWLDIPVEENIRRSGVRGKKDRIEQAPIEFHQRVRDGYMKLWEVGALKRVDGTRTRNEVTAAIKDLVLDLLQE